MSATLKQLRDQIIIDAGIEGQTKFPIARLNRMINQAQKFVQLKIVGLGMKKWEKKSSSITPSAATFVGNNVKMISISTDLSDLLESSDSIPFIEVSDGANNGLAYPVDKERFLSQISNTYMTPSIADNESVFMRLSGSLYIAPSSVTTAYVHYHKVVPDLIDVASETEIPVEHEEHIIRRVVIEIDDILGKLNDKQNEINNLENEISKVYQSFQLSRVEDERIAQKDQAKLQ